MVNRYTTLVTLLMCFIISAALLLSCKKETGGSGGPRSNDTLPVTRKPPVANAGADQNIIILNHYFHTTLNGSASYDSNGTALKYKWRQLTGPTNIFIQSPEAVQTQFSTVNGPAVFTFELKVYNINGSDLDTVMISSQYPGYCQASRQEIPVSLSYLSELPSHVQGPEMYAAGNKLIFPAWFDNTTGITSNKIHIYDLMTGTWNTINASLERTAVSTVVAGDKIIFAGGVDRNYRASRVVDIYDMTTNSWTVNQLSEARSGISGVLHGNKIYFAGGFGDNEITSRRIDVYDLQSKTWSTDELPSVARTAISTVSLSDKVIFAGGYSEFDGLGSAVTSPVIDIYNPVGNFWTRDTLKFNKVEFAAIAVNDNVYFAGGTFQYGASFDVDIRNWTTSSKSSSCLFQPMVASNANSAVLKNDKILFYSYSPYSGIQRNKLDIYNWQTNVWSVGVLPMNLVPDNNVGTAMAVAGQQVYIIIEDKLYKMNI
jgi:hypothetical protein